MRTVCLLLLALVCVKNWTQATVSDEFLSDHQDRLGRMIVSLDPAIPEMRQIMTDWEKGLERPATEALVKYFRGRHFELSRMGPVVIPPDFMDHAMAAGNDTFLIHGSWIKVPRTQTGQLDWNYRGDSGDKEIAWMLNRHGFLPILAKAAKQTRNPEFREIINNVLVSWIENSPYPDRISFSAQWRPLEAARRVMNSWIHVFYESTDLLDDETILLVLTSVMEHADALLEHASFWGGNHLLTEKTALLAIGAAWPEFLQSQEWRSSAFEKVTELLERQFYPDGSHKELSNHYQRVVLANTIPLLGLMHADMVDNKDNPAYKRITGMWEFFAWSMKPDGSGPVNNASDKEMNSDLVKSVWTLFDRSDWLGMATNGGKGILPTGSASRCFPWAGQVFIRSNWSKAADWIYFDAGPYGTAHQHVDRLHLSITLKGRDLLSDSGRYTYQPGRWHDYFKGPRSHSVALLDGHPARQGPRETEKPMDVVFQELKDAIFTSASAVFHPGGEPFRSPVPWTRDVVYDKRGLVIVLDHFEAFKMYQLEVLWQFSTGVSPEEAQATVQTSHPFLLKESVVTMGNECDPISGFFSPDYSRKSPTVQINNIFSIQSPTTIAHVIQSPGGRRLSVQTSRNRQSGIVKFTLFQDGIKFSEGEIDIQNNRRLVKYVTWQGR